MKVTMIKKKASILYKSFATHAYFLFVEVQTNQKKANEVSPKANSG